MSDSNQDKNKHANADVDVDGNPSDLNMHLPFGATASPSGNQMVKVPGAETLGRLTWFPGKLPPVIERKDPQAAAPGSPTQDDTYLLQDATAMDIDTITWQSGTTVRITFNGGPSLPSIGDYLHVTTATATSNNGSFIVTAAPSYVEITNAARTDGIDDEASDSPAVSKWTEGTWDGSPPNAWVRYDNVASADIWRFIVPQKSNDVFNEDTETLWFFNGTIWSEQNIIVPSATETTEGKAELATQAEVDAGTDTTRIVTPKTLADTPEFDRLGWNMAPTSNGVLNILGWYEQTDAAASLTSASPVVPSTPGYHSHYVIDLSAVSGAPFTLRITGTSIDEATAVETPADTEDIAITGNGFVQSVKSWVDAPSISIVEASKSATIDVFRTSYWDHANKDYTVDGIRMEWTPDVTSWSIEVTILRVDADGSTTSIENVTFTNSDSPPRAANGVVGKHKKAFNFDVEGSGMEGLVIEVTQTNMQNFYLEIAHHD